MENKNLIVSPSPHVHSKDSISGIMKDVLIALLPATLAGVYFFGLRALLIIILAVSSSVLFEAAYQKITNQPITINDCSAAVTGLLLALNISSQVPLWIPILGSFFAIVVIKQLFGGLGQNFMNPALGARVFLLTYTMEMTKWSAPSAGFMNLGTDFVSQATPLSVLKAGEFIPTTADYISAFIGNIGGSIGETSALLLILGGIYLMYKKVITWRIPFTYIGSMLIFSFIFGRNGFFTGLPFYEVLLGGVMIGAFYMATDYSSSPVTPVGQIIMGIACGFLTSIFRAYGSGVEAVSYVIVLINLVVPLIDKFVKPKVFGKNLNKSNIEGVTK